MNRQDRAEVRRVIAILNKGEYLDDEAREYWSYSREAISQAVPALLELIGDCDPNSKT